MTNQIYVTYVICILLFTYESLAMAKHSKSDVNFEFATNIAQD